MEKHQTLSLGVAGSSPAYGVKRIEFNNQFGQLKAVDITNEQAGIIANELSKIDGRLNNVQEEIGKLHSKFDDKHELMMYELKEIKEDYI